MVAKGSVGVGMEGMGRALQNQGVKSLHGVEVVVRGLRRGYVCAVRSHLQLLAIASSSPSCTTPPACRALPILLTVIGVHVCLGLVLKFYFFSY